jgi:hypothetical protein
VARQTAGKSAQLGAELGTEALGAELGTEALGAELGTDAFGGGGCDDGSRAGSTAAPDGL